MSLSIYRASVRHQIGFIGLIGVLGLIVLGAVHLIGGEMLASADQRLARMNATMAKLGQIHVNLLEARRSEKDFLLRRREEFVGKHAEALATFSQNSATLSTLVSERPAILLASVNDSIRRYKDQFDTVRDLMRKVGLDENSGLQGALRKSVREIEGTIEGGGNDALSASMLMMRRHEKDFLARHDPRYVAALKAEAGTFAAKIEASAFGASQKAGIIERLISYQRDFEAAATGVLDLNQAVSSLSKLYAEADPIIGELDQLLRELAEQEKAEVERIGERARTIMLISVPTLTLLVVLLSWLIGRHVSRPLTAMAGLMDRLAQGDLNVEISHSKRSDEIGTLAASLEVFKRNALDARRLAAEQNEEHQAKERRREAMERYIATFEHSMQDALDALASASTEMRAASHSMSVIAAEASQMATNVSTAAEKTSMNVQTVAASTEELSISVSEIGTQVVQSTRIAGEAVQEAERTNQTVHGLAEAATSIGDVVKLISAIANQTNLLALNATIEAARAGDAGKGFAVVASEVKSLANQTAKATDDITQHVAAMQGATSVAVSAIAGIGGTINSISEIATTIASAVEEQSAATSEIARSIQEAAVGANLVSTNIVGVSQAAAETGATSAQVLTAAEQLGKQAETLRADVHSFLSNIRAA